VTNLVFAMGEVQQTIEIPLIDDLVIQPTLTVNLALNPVPPAQYGNQPTAVLNLVNVNSLVRFAAATYQVPKNIINGQAAITVVRTGSTAGTSTVQFDTTTNGTAQAIIDYIPRNNITVTFNPGVTQQVVNVPIVNNGLPQGNRTVSLALTNVTGSLLTAPTNALLTIIDTVTAPGELLFTATNYPAAEGNTNVFLTVLRTNGSAGSISFSYTTIAGSGLPGVNYVTTTNTAAMGDGVTSRVIAIPLLENNTVQGPVNFSVVIYSPSGGATLSFPTLATVTVDDNDTGLAFAAATNAVSESTGVAAVNVVRLVNTSGNVSVDYVTAGVTAVT
jgi:hypothetical protein